MIAPPKSSTDRRSRQVAPEPIGSPVAIAIVSWLVPGAGHLLVGQIRKGGIFFVSLLGMFVCGVLFGGRLFPFQLSDPLVFLAALAEWALGLPALISLVTGYGQGLVVAPGYEFGNTFLIGAGLLNALVGLDAFDVATGAKR